MQAGEPRNTNGPNSKQPSYTNPPDMTPRREGGDDALAETAPDDARADEKVIVNAPSQTAANTNNAVANNEEVV